MAPFTGTFDPVPDKYEKISYSQPNPCVLGACCYNADTHLYYKPVHPDC